VQSASQYELTTHSSTLAQNDSISKLLQVRSLAMSNMISTKQTVQSSPRHSNTSSTSAVHRISGMASEVMVSGSADWTLLIILAMWGLAIIASALFGVAAERERKVTGQNEHKTD